MSDIQVSHSTSPNNARSESSVVANPNNPNHLVGASKKFTNPHAYQFTLAAYYSTDAGHTWTESPTLTLLSGWGGISDPALAWDNQNNCFLVALPFDTSANMNIIGIAVYKSTNGGVTWSNPTVIHGSPGDDKQWAIGDPSSGTVYAAWDDGSTLRFARTTNHGTSWKGTTGAAGASLATDSFAPEMAINSSGHLYIFWSVRQAGIIKFVKSTNGGDSFSAPQIAVSGMTDLENVLPFTGGFAHLPGGQFRVLTLVTCCVGRNNEIMVAWADGREIDGTGNHVSRIYYRRSVNGGATWLGSSSGDPLLGNNSSVSKTMHHFHPQIINRPNTDQVGCAFYEFGPKISTQMLIDTMIAYSLNNGGSFGSAVVVTDAPWNPLIDAPWSHGNSSVHFIGDYFGLDGSNVGFYPFWTDTRTGIQEIFTDIVHPLVKSYWKEIKEATKEYKEFDKLILKDKALDKISIPEKVQIKDKDKEKDIYEDLGQKLAAEVVDPIERGIDERFRALEGRLQDLESQIRKGDVFIAPEQRPDVGRKVVKRSNRRARKKKAS
jgi:hypothetical protein